MSVDEPEAELRVTFQPSLYLQRQTWVLDILRHENVESVLDIGCGEGSLLQCLAQPAFTLPPNTSLPASSPFVSSNQTDLYLKAIHGLDPYAPNLEFAILGTAPPPPNELPFTGYERWTRREARWMPLEVNTWEGGFEVINEAFEGDSVDAFVASEVIEHLTPELLPLFAPVLLGHYRPRLLLLTTPNFTYNQRFTRPGEVSPTGYPDPTGRTDRVFRHDDHKFEWTTEEWTQYCTDSASKFGYSVDVGGIGLAVEPDPWNREDTIGFASQVAVFRRLDDNPPQANLLDLISSKGFSPGQQHIHRVTHNHLPHPLSLEELALSCNVEEIQEAVKAAMNDNRNDTMTFAELWAHGEISLKCRGDVGALVNAFEVVHLDPDVWLLGDEGEAWGMKVVWKKFVGTADSPEPSEPEAYPLPSGDMGVEGVEVAEDLLPTERPLTDNDGKEETASNLANWSWGRASESGQTHWGWDDINGEACDTSGKSPWSGSVAQPLAFSEI